MPQPIRLSVVALSVAFFVVALYYRIRSQSTREPLDRTKEGWPILIGLRLAGVGAMLSTAMWLYRPSWFSAIAVDLPEGFRWLGVLVLSCAIAWLLWMFHSLGRNLTDTVVTRRDATFVDYGPYRYIRNPMYTGVLVLGIGLGLALGSWHIPLLAALVFVLMAVRTRIEEKYLVARFGDRYRDYMTRVPRFIPKITR